MSTEQHDPLNKILLDEFEGPVPDDGFSARVMDVLPARRRRQAWPLALGIAAGGVLCWLSLLIAPFSRVGWHDWMGGNLSTPAVTLMAAMAGLTLLALAWTASEADDR